MNFLFKANASGTFVQKLLFITFMMIASLSLGGRPEYLISSSEGLGKVEKILKGSLDSIPSPSPSVKIQNMGGKVCLRCIGKTLLGIMAIRVVEFSNRGYKIRKIFA